MLQANELRLNNLMQDAKGRICKVERLSLDPDEVRISAIKGAITTGAISPIPLTEEILLKCGFEGEDSNIYVHVAIGSIYLIKPYKDCEHYLVKYGLAGGLTSLKHLHQLQNLYFAFTGKELEVKLQI